MNLKLVANHAAVNVTGYVKGEANGEIQVANPKAGETAVIGGTITLTHTSFGMPSGPAGSAPPQFVSAGYTYPPVGLNVNVALGDDVKLQSTTVAAPLMPTTQAAVIRGTIRQPDIHGTVALAPRRGRVTSSALVLDSGVLTFHTEVDGTAPLGARIILLKGTYDVQAEQTLVTADVDGRNVGPVHVDMKIHGVIETAGGPRVEVSSEPELTQEQILTLIGLSAYAPGGTTDASQLLSQRAVSLLASGIREALLSPIEAQLTKSLGLQEFTLVASFNQPLEVNIGKYLFKNLLLSYRYTFLGSQDVRWNMGLSYQLPARHYLVTFATNESGDIQFRVTRSWSF